MLQFVVDDDTEVTTTDDPVGDVSMVTFSADDESKAGGKARGHHSSSRSSLIVDLEDGKEEAATGKEPSGEGNSVGSPAKAEPQSTREEIAALRQALETSIGDHERKLHSITVALQEIGQAVGADVNSATVWADAEGDAFNGRTLGMALGFDEHQLDSLHEIFEESDLDHNSSIDAGAEFAMLVKRAGGGKEVSEEKLAKLLKSFDHDDSQSITFDELVLVVGSVGMGVEVGVGGITAREGLSGKTGCPAT